MEELVDRKPVQKKISPINRSGKSNSISKKRGKKTTSSKIIDTRIKKIKIKNDLTNLPKITSKVSDETKQKYADYEKIEPINSASTLEEIFSLVVPDIAHDMLDLEKLKSKFIAELQYAKIQQLSLFGYEKENEIYEPCLVYDVIPTSLSNITVGSIDGSFVKRNFNGLDLYLSRAIGVLYKFREDGKPSISYYPDARGCQNYKLNRILKNISEEEANTQISIERAIMEVDLVNKMISANEEKIDLFILDGSILTQPLNYLLSENEDLMDKYLDLIEKYKKMYSLCEKKKILLVGVIKDTRSSTFRKLFSRRIPHIIRKISQLSGISNLNYRKLMAYFSDLDLFRRLLEPGERTCSFSINSSVTSWVPHQFEVLNSEISDEQNLMNEYNFLATYLKPVAFDFPIRVEFYLNRKKINTDIVQKTVNQICSILLPLSSKLENFAIPLPQIEAHLRAKLSNNDLETILKILNRKISEEISNYSKEFVYKSEGNKNKEIIDEFMLKNKMIVTKRRERLPI